MGLQCGIIGLTNSGKTTLFNCLSNTRAETKPGYGTARLNLGVINVPDQRLYKISNIVNPQKTVPATVDIVDIPGLTKGSDKGGGPGNKFLSDIRNTDALIHVIRCFDNENIHHIDGSVDPVRDRETVDFELQLKDLESIEKKIQKLQKAAKVGDKDAQHGLEVLNIYKEHLEAFGYARNAPVDEKDKKYIEDIFLLTNKPVIYVCNVDEASAVSGNKYTQALKEAVKDEDTEVLIIAAELESEIAELDEEEDRTEFLRDMGLSEPGVNKLVRSAYSVLKLQSFFTEGPKEVRAWTIKRGMTAPQAAGVIHSDLERGFIRAEVITYDDFITLGSEHACREAGKLRVEGKNYIVRDGDILHIRFNV